MVVRSYSRILVPYDGSELSEKALRTAVKAASANKRIELHVLHIMKSVGPLEENREAVQYMHTERAKEMLRNVEECLYDVGNPLYLPLKDGDAGKEIVKYSKEAGCDLIVMGSRGLSAIKEWFLGSVSHYVTQHASCSVLIVK